MTDAAVATLPDEALDAFVAAAEQGIDWEQLTADHTEAGFEVAVDGTARRGLTESDLRAAARTHAPAVAEWYVWTRVVPDDPARRAFLRWVEGAADRDPAAHRRALRDGVTRHWGQLRLRASLADDGRRRYDVRHEADADRPTDDLTVHADPGALRDLVRHDEYDRYRPLKSAPTLVTGWALTDLDPDGVLEAVETCYPASIANWHREREGDLDVTHWRETAERQTGIYDVVDELDGEQVEWLAGACCVDSQCLKRRQWDETADETLDVPRGDGAFPCREPCSLVIAAAREFARGERATGERVRVELDATELAQLERILDAVADGEIDEIRDGDLGDGANRLRARYLREKLFDEDGHLPRTGEQED